ncbi:hypothetical protein FNV43_RR24696 [Rhamnella rubrinervis]|uniref:Uncharacterized protein n=1 Tax=Rhamnella rubrinervis TaxID=2594499 RepID=A0A8K0DT26_9ROSA|nr:hypothetical protein FNV43_RR24696 [Rhamnella rubrinervis]
MKYNYNMVAIIVVVIVWILGGLDEVYGGSECGKTSPEAVVYKLVPCAAAAQDNNAKLVHFVPCSLYIALKSEDQK